MITRVLQGGFDMYRKIVTGIIVSFMVIAACFAETYNIEWKNCDKLSFLNATSDEHVYGKVYVDEKLVGVFNCREFGDTDEVDRMIDNDNPFRWTKGVKVIILSKQSGPYKYTVHHDGTDIQIVFEDGE
jgi:hypothetical protein